jgi:hypothetical protein
VSWQGLRDVVKIGKHPPESSNPENQSVQTSSPATNKDELATHGSSSSLLEE